MTEDLKDLNLDGSSADKLLHIGKKENKDIVKIYGLVYKSCNKQNYFFFFCLNVFTTAHYSKFV